MTSTFKLNPSLPLSLITLLNYENKSINCLNFPQFDCAGLLLDPKLLTKLINLEKKYPEF